MLIIPKRTTTDSKRKQFRNSSAAETTKLCLARDYSKMTTLEVIPEGNTIPFFGSLMTIY